MIHPQTQSLMKNHQRVNAEVDNGENTAITSQCALGKMK